MTVSAVRRPRVASAPFRRWDGLRGMSSQAEPARVYAVPVPTPDMNRKFHG